MSSAGPPESWGDDGRLGRSLPPFFPSCGFFLYIHYIHFFLNGATASPTTSLVVLPFPSLSSFFLGLRWAGQVALGLDLPSHYTHCVDPACGGYLTCVPSACAFFLGPLFSPPGEPWRLCAVGLFGLVGGRFEAIILWVPHHVKRRSSTLPFALISVTDRPWRMVSMAWSFAHPRRSDVARCVTSKMTDLAEEPKPPHVVNANELHTPKKIN